MKLLLKIIFLKADGSRPGRGLSDPPKWSVIILGLLALGWGSLRAEVFLPGLTQAAGIPSHVRGEILIDALGCVACHEDASLHASRYVAPDLTHVGDRVRPEWLETYLSAPQKAKPGTMMPDLFATLSSDEKVETIQKLTHFLMTQKPEEVQEPWPTNGSAENGQHLFHSTGCFACHPFGETLKTSDWLANLQSKFKPNALLSFLKDPLSVHPNGIMPDMNMSHDEAVDLTTFLMGERSSVEQAFEVNAGMAQQGRRIFGELGCVHCHTSLGAKENINNNTAFTGPALRSVDAWRGCLSGEEGPWPHYDFSSDQRKNITEALRHGNSLSETEKIQTHLVKFNCIACHQRDGVGGVPESLDAYFTTSDLNLGEQGRLPPSLDGVGAKLTPVWLRKILVQGAVSRPYLKVRMPRFGAVVADQLVDLFVHADDLEPVGDIEMPNENDSRRAGRDLAGIDGMSCITCHTFRGTKTGAMGGIDLTLPGQRLTREWFHHYMRQPQRFRPGTLMPDFWPEGHSSKPDILEGDASKQIEALWVFLSDGYSIGIPKGVHREPMRLLAKVDEAVILRRSYPGIGKRGIGVGYPNGVNLVFNAEQLCLAMIWKGEFADPAGVWLSQGHGNVRPLAREQIRFANVPQVQVLPDPQSPWPDSDERSAHHVFKGYRLDPKRRPTFLYEVNGVVMEDAFRDVMSGDSTVLQREIKSKSSERTASFVFRAAQGELIVALGEGRFRVEQDLIVEVLQGGEAWVVDGSESQELRIRMSKHQAGQALKLNYEF